MEKRLFSQEELGGFFLGLAHLIHAGLGTGDALGLMAEDERDPARAALLGRMARQADEGVGLAALLASEGAFPAYAAAMAAAGEETGRLEEALFAMAEYYDGLGRQDRQLKAALLHPLVLLGVLVVVICVLLGWVLPVFDDVYRQLGSSLTGVAGGLLTAGQAIRGALPVLLPIVVVICIVVLRLFFSERGREKLLSGRWGALACGESARLARVLAMGLGSGLSEERAMELAAAMGAEGSQFRRKCEDCLQRIRGQETLPQALRSAGLMDAADCRLLEAGWRGGCADTVMAQLAGRLQERSEARTEAFLARVEPVLVLISSVLVGLILLSVLLPLARIMAAMG